MTDRVAECLRLRDWVIPFLTQSVTARALVDTFPDVSPDAWSLFLAAETVAWPLATRLGAHVSGLSPSARSELERAARLEAQRIMAARAELHVVDRLADEADVAPIVLKGGVALADGSNGFDLGDLDLLLTPNDGARFGRALVEHGGYRYEKSMGGCYVCDDALPIEIHDALEVGHGVEQASIMQHAPFGAFRRLRRLTPAAHVLYMIQHSTTKHALRRGHLRDVLLIASALDACSLVERAEVGRAVHESALRHVYEPMLLLARATQSDERAPAPAADVFRRVAAGKYATSVWFPHGSPPILPLFLDQVPHFVASTSDARRLVIGYLNTSNPVGSHWYSSSIARVSAPLARTLGAAVRTPYRLLALSAAGAVGGYIRWCYRRRWSDDARGTAHASR